MKWLKDIKDRIEKLENDFGYARNSILVQDGYRENRVANLEKRLEMLEKYLKIEPKPGTYVEARYVKKGSE